MYGYSVVYEGILSCKCFIVQLIILNNQLNLIPGLLWLEYFHCQSHILCKELIISLSLLPFYTFWELRHRLRQIDFQFAISRTEVKRTHRTEMS